MSITPTRDSALARQRMLVALRALPDHSSGMDAAELGLRAGVGAHRSHGIVCELVADGLATERPTVSGTRYRAA